MNRIKNRSCPGIVRVRATILSSVALVAFSAFGATYYVDANNGNDGRDGSSPQIGAGDVGPRRTLVGVMGLGLSSGDVVYAAPGTYDELSDNGYRVRIPSGVKLIASGSKEETFILGEAAPDTAADRDSLGNGTGAIRCAYLNANARLVGFTLTGGHTPTGGNGKNGGGCAAGSDSAAVIDCVVSNNFAQYRGGAFYAGPATVRCLFANNSCAGGVGQSKCSGTAYNCVFAESPGYHVYGGTLYNCTALYDVSNFRNATVCNSILLKKDSGDNVLHRCVYVEKGGGTTVDEDCIKISSEEAASFLDEYWRPFKDSVVVNAGNLEYYIFPDALESEKYMTLRGHRFIGDIDIGAVEYDWRTLPTESGLEFSETDVAGGTTLRVWRNFTSESLLTGFVYGGTTNLFDNIAEGEWETLVPDSNVEAFLEPLYASAGQMHWYVNASEGSDGNKGYHRLCPRKTLASVMELAADGDVVHAAGGDYDEGEVFANGMTNRVQVKEGVGLVADDGPKLTTIKGKPASTGDGIGADAVRCVSLASRAWIQGFTITNGFTSTMASDETSSFGGGVYARPDSAMIDCEIAGNGCGYRGTGVYRGTGIRCFFHGTPPVGNYVAYRMSSLVNCVFVDGAICYGDSTPSVVLNCLMAGGSTWGAGTVLCNSYVKSHGGKAIAGITNCVLGVTEGYVKGTAYDPLTCKFSVDYDDLNLDGDYRPRFGSVLVDFANKELYDAYFPEQWNQFKNVDFSKGQRIYNGFMDVGAGEYDWRTSFSAELNRAGKAAVVLASENVATNAIGGICLSGGDAVEIVYSPSVSGRCSFCVSKEDGGGTVVAKLGEETLLPDEHGVYCYECGTDGGRIAISYVGEGAIVVSKFTGPMRGFSIMFK